MGFDFENTPGAAATPNNRVFADDTTVAPATAGEPTTAEIATFASNGSHTDALIYYTGNDTASDPVTHVFNVDPAGNVTLVDEVITGTAARVAFFDVNGDITDDANFTYNSGTGNLAVGTNVALARIHSAINDTSTVLADNAEQVGLVIQQANSTDDNWGLLSYYSAGGVIGATIAAQYKSHAGAEADIAFGARGTNGFAERMRITGNGAVGIGTDTPDHIGFASTRTLNVHTATGHSGLSLTTEETADGANMGGVVFGSTAMSGVERSAMIVSLKTSASTVNAEGNLTFWTNNGTTLQESMRITENGAVGIGTSEPSTLGAGGSPSILHVHSAATGTADYGTLMLSSAGVTNTGLMGAIQFGSTGLSGTEKRTAFIASTKTGTSTSVPNGNLTFHTSDGTTPVEHMRITQTGQVHVGGAIGTSTARFGVTDHTFTTGDIASIGGNGITTGHIFTVATGGTGLNAGANDGSILFQNAGLPTNLGAGFFRVAPFQGITNGRGLTVTNNGDVGFGTSAPEAIVHVQSGDASTGPNVNADELFIEGSGNSGMTIASGSTSIGTINFGRSDTNLAGSVSYDHDNNALRFGTLNNATRVIIDSVGNLGVGTTSPAANVHINPASNAVASLYVGGDQLSTEQAHLEIGNGRTGDGYSFIDLIGDATHADYGFRMIRNNGGPNTSSILHHRGTGNFTLSADDAGSITFNTNSSERMSISSAGVITMNNLGTGDVQSTAGVLSVTSDGRHKTNINPFTKGLDALAGITPKTYEWNEESGKPTDLEMTGFIAQELLETLPEAVTGSEDTEYGLDSRAIIAALVNAVNELSARVVALEN